MHSGERFWQFRTERGLTQRDLAAKISVTDPDVSKVENENLHFGDYPSEKFIHKLADVLDADEEELLLLADKVPEAIGKRREERPSRHDVGRSNERWSVEPDRDKLNGVGWSSCSRHCWPNAARTELWLLATSFHGLSGLARLTSGCCTMSSSIPLADRAAALKREFDLLADRYPELSHVVIWPEGGWGFESGSKSTTATSQLVAANVAAWEVATSAAHTGKPWWFPVGRFQCHGIDVEGAYFDTDHPTVPFDADWHQTIAYDPDKTQRLLVAITEFQRRVREAVECSRLSSGSSVFSPPQKNSWVNFGSGRAPRL